MEQLSGFAPDQASFDLNFLRNGGDVGALLQSRDWTGSPLGYPANWSPTLKTLMSTLLPAKAQIVLFWGPKFVALYNDAYVPTIGAKHPRALGRPAIENWSELWSDLGPLLEGVWETGETFTAQDRPFYIERDGRGETAYFDVSYSAVREETGSVGGVLCIVTETTDRVRFERRQAFLLELSQTLRSSSDPEEIEILALRKIGEALGASRVFFGEDNGDGESFRVHRDYYQSNRSACGQHRYRDFGGDLLRALRSGLPVIRDDIASEKGLPAGEMTLCGELDIAATLHIPVIRHGILEATLAIHHDHPHDFLPAEVNLAEEIAKLIWNSVHHARAEMALRASSAQLSAIFDQCSAGIAVCDQDGIFTRVNDRYCEIVGRSRETLLGLSLRDISQADHPLPEPLVDDSLCMGPLLEGTGRYILPNGQSVWVQNQITPLVGEQEQFTGILLVCVDISARVRAEVELRKLNEDLEGRVASMVTQRESAVAQLHEARKMEMVGQLTGGIAHDFNNLLTPIMASLELIRRRLTEERDRGLIDGALLSADRARILVGRLLTFARRQTLKPQAVALHTLMNDMNDLLGRSLGPTIPVTIEIPEQLPPVIVDPHQLELAILNLAVNGRDAMPDGGGLTIGARVKDVAEDAVKGIAAGRYMCLTVTDNGCGMSADTLERCMEPFFSTKGVGKGTGLGLSMVQGLAAQSGGGLSIASESGRGTEVSLWLPIGEGAEVYRSEAAVDAPVASRPTRVLLVDDEELVRETTALQLGELGYQVISADSAAAALGLVEGGLKPDVLVTDHIMADKTGVQLAHELRQHNERLPVLIITGFANLTPKQLRGFEVLTKPYRRVELAERLAQLLSTPHR